ncbi:MAG: hypothetical protein IJ924_03575 [Bacteroidaceae bacterium]|nr:hypothetical protein [Bacteroidaceae bacterium]
MKKIFLLGCLLLSTVSFAQKRPLDHSVYDGWKHVESSKISTKGNFVVIQTDPQQGDGVLTIHRVKNGQELKIARGYNATLLPNEQYAVCLIKPHFADTRQARIDKKKADDMPKDSLAIVRLSDFQTTKIPFVTSYRIGAESNEAVAYISADTTGIDKKAKGAKPLQIYHFANAKTDTIKQVDKYAFSNDGLTLVYTTDDGKKHPTVGVYSVATSSTKELSSGQSSTPCLSLMPRAVSCSIWLLPILWIQALSIAIFITIEWVMRLRVVSLPVIISRDCLRVGG